MKTTLEIREFLPFFSRNNIITFELATNCGENIDEEEIKKAAYEILQLEKEDIIDIYFNL